jgi:NTP pyrophosphatase (non-canonical NTP hydrolase)
MGSEIKNLIERNYKVTCARGKITHETTYDEFLDKYWEEYGEFERAKEYPNDNYLHPDEQKELADIVLVIFNWLHHNNIDIEKLLNEKIDINESRI